MSVYRKDDNGNIKKIAGSLTQRINMHIFQTTHEFDTEKNEDNYIINESDAKPYISSIKDWTQYSINLSEPNQSSNINIKLGSQTLKLINSVKNIEIGTLNSVIQCHTEKLDNNEIFLDVVGTVVSLNGVEKTSINTDTTPTANSENLITSGGVHDYPAIIFAESERQKSKNLCGLIDFEQTVNGVTIRLVSASQTVTLNGTATSTFDAMTTVRNMLPYVSNMQGEDLKVSAYYLSGTKSDSAFAFISTVDNDDVFGDRSAGVLLPDNNLTSINFSPSKNSTYNTLMLYTPSGTSFTNYMFRIQIEKGQVTNWEYPHGPISHNKELDDVAVSNSTFDLSVANANSYQSVYDLLRVNKGVGNFYFAGHNFPSFLPPCPDDVWHGEGNIDQIVVKIDTNNFTKSLSMTLQGVNQNTPAYKLDAYFDGTNWRNSGWYKPIAIDLIYEMNTKNTIGGKPYTAGIPFYSTTISNVDFSPYKHVRLTCRWNDHSDNWFGGTITFDLDLTTPYNSDAEYMSVISSRPSSCYVADNATTFDLVGQIIVNGNKNSLGVNGYKITYTGERTTYTSDNYLPYFRIEKMEGYK